MRIPNWLFLGLVILVSACWATSFFVGLADTSYQPPDAINGLFGAIVGGLVFSRRGGNGGNGEGGGP